MTDKMVSIDHLTVPAVLMETLNVLLILPYDRRKILGYKVTGVPATAP